MSQKNMDNHNRWRNVTVAFRVSPEEDELLEHLVNLSGMTKQDYIIAKLLNREITVHGNPRVYKALRNEMQKIQDELSRIAAGSEVADELLEVIRQINTTMKGLKGTNG